MKGRKKVKSTPSKRPLTKQQRQSQKEEVVKWLLDNYQLSEDVAVPRDLVYQHYCHFCYKRDEDIGSRSYFTKTFSTLFPCLPTRRFSHRGDSRCFYDGLDINSSSDYFSVIAPQRVVHHANKDVQTVQTTRPPHVKVCSFFHKTYLHRAKPLPETVKTVDNPAETEDKKDVDFEPPPAKRPATMPPIDPQVYQDRIDDVGQFLNPSNDDEPILSLFDLGHNNEEISKMAEELLMQDPQDDLYNLMLQESKTDDLMSSFPSTSDDVDSSSNCSDDSSRDCNSNSISPKDTEMDVTEDKQAECVRSQLWKGLTDDQRRLHIEDVLHWLGTEYEVAPKMCVPRQTVYDHYLDYCNSSQKPAAGITLFGRILQKQFPRLTMRRLGGRGESRYFYMGIDILESSPQYARVIARRVYSATAKPKSSIINVHKREIRGST